MKCWLRPLVVLVTLAAVTGALVLVSGIVPIKASSGHWAITAWVLDFAKNRSVATHTLGIKAPEMNDPDLVLKGAGPYHLTCAPCHGSPQLRDPVVPLQMTPPPPYLPASIAQWKPEELFYIVKHGIKFTGMPAWPAQGRDDEVWAVVAFLLQMPEMDAAEYRLLTQGRASHDPSVTAMESLEDPGAAAPSLVQMCAACHGASGRGRGADGVPLIAGQHPIYLAASLEAYARGDRHSGIMQPVAWGLEADDIRQLAQYYGANNALDADAVAEPGPRPDDSPPTTARLTDDAAAISDTSESDAAPAASSRSSAAGDRGPTGSRQPKPEQGDEQSIARGAQIAHHGVPADKIPSCADCHGPDVPEGSRASRNQHYPVLAGQNVAYLVLQLRLFKERARGGSQYAHLMHPVADALDAQQMHDVARYYASLAGVPDGP